jgi:hypothetical protein
VLLIDCTNGISTGVNCAAFASAASKIYAGGSQLAASNEAGGAVQEYGGTSDDVYGAKAAAAASFGALSTKYYDSYRHTLKDDVPLDKLLRVCVISQAGAITASTTTSVPTYRY